jgi:glycosyltransferase involved in cell wall biosynthesis
MNVVQISTSDIQGGAARAAFRLNQALNKLNVNSKMLVQSKTGDDVSVKSVAETKIQKGLTKIRPYYDMLHLKLYKNIQKGPFSVAGIGVDICKNNYVKETDLINLHWINAGFLSLKSIKKLNQLNKPIVWTLHDMWPFTGGCHYSGGCTKYKEKCGQCPMLNSNKDRDLTRRIWGKKNKYYKNLNLTIVTCSTWLAQCAKDSSLFNDLGIEVIPNSVDINIFKPIKKEIARDILNLPQNRYLLLFGAMSAISDKRKGFYYLNEALGKIKKDYPQIKDDIELLVFGASYSEDINNLSIKTNFLGRLNDEQSIALCYSAADIFITPSLEDNLPNTIMESLSCGTPVVGFKIGGIPDMIGHKQNGYLAEYKSVDDLAQGIYWMLEDKKRLIDLGQNARQKVLDNYTYDIVGNRYLKLYKQLLDEYQ